MTKRIINMDMIREARKNLEKIAREHPELTNQSGENAERLFQGVFDMVVDKGKLTFSLSEAAEILGVHSETVRRAIKAGKLKAAKTGRDYRISRADLQAYWRELGGSELFESNE